MHSCRMAAPILYKIEEKNLYIKKTLWKEKYKESSKPEQ